MFIGGNGTASDPYLVSTEEDFNSVNGNYYYKQVNDIVFTVNRVLTVRNVNSYVHYDGQNYRLTGLNTLENVMVPGVYGYTTSNWVRVDCHGFFRSGVISNVIFENCYTEVVLDDEFGGVLPDGYIRNPWEIVEVYAGMLGHRCTVNNVEMYNCTFKVTQSKSINTDWTIVYYIGLVTALGSVKNAAIGGNIDIQITNLQANLRTGYIGGIIGEGECQDIDSNIDINIVSPGYSQYRVGGIVGNTTHLRNLLYSGDIILDTAESSRIYIGGIAGITRGYHNEFARMASYANLIMPNTPNSCVFGGLIGICSAAAYIRDSFNKSTVIGVSEAAGLVGDTSGVSTGTVYVSRFYSIGNSGYTNDIVCHWGGLAQDISNEDSIIVCSDSSVGQAGWTVEPSRQILYRTMLEMQTKSTYTVLQDRFDFGLVWGIDPTINNGTPYLRVGMLGEVVKVASINKLIEIGLYEAGNIGVTCELYTAYFKVVALNDSNASPVRIMTADGIKAISY